MGGLNVKNTMVERCLQIVAPHPCLGCGKLGGVLCGDCKYNIIHEPSLACVVCGVPNSGGVCIYHNTSFNQVLVIGERTGALKDSIDALKFSNNKAAAGVLAELLDAALPLLPPNTQVVAVPTVWSHVRKRGYDHAALIAQQFAALRALSYGRPLLRASNSTQHTVGRVERATQAAHAFKVDEKYTPVGPVVLVDDIITTGATIEAAAKELRAAGATVFVAALAYQPLD